jgi:Flp pilus assembly protein TadD
MREFMPIRRTFACALIAASCLSLAAPAAAQGSYSPYNETATAALARYVRALAETPNDFVTLVAAGRAALEVGDTGTAAGFFARADEVSPKSWQPQAGMGAVTVANGEPQAALAYFNRAQQLGGTVGNFGADRGLAFDLLGRHAEAQADYRAALAGSDADTARARLALSLAISGNRAEALTTLAPLQAKGDPAGARARAFVLALTGDPAGARGAIEAAMPGSSSTLAPFLARLTALNSGQKAAAVNLGHFPDDGAALPTYAVAAAPVSVPPVAAPPPAAPAVKTTPTWQTASASVPARTQLPAQPKRSSAAAKKIWLQLAEGSDRSALGSQFASLKSRNRDLFDGITGYVAQSGSAARLVIGPFRSASDADTFAEDLESVNVNARPWKNSDSDLIVPVGTN